MTLLFDSLDAFLAELRKRKVEVVAVHRGRHPAASGAGCHRRDR